MRNENYPQNKSSLIKATIIKILPSPFFAGLEEEKLKTSHVKF